MAYAANPVIFRIEWCHRQKAKARTETEVESWHAEEEGLRDALFSRNRTSEYEQSPPEVFERYRLGLHDGQVLMRAAWVDRS